MHIAVGIALGVIIYYIWEYFDNHPPKGGGTAVVCG